MTSVFQTVVYIENADIFLLVTFIRRLHINRTFRYGATSVR